MLKYLLLSIIMTGSAFADISLTYEFDAPIIEKRDEFHRITMPGLRSYGNPCEPVLPYKAVKILIPMGQRVLDVEVIPYDKIELPGSYKIECGQFPVPLSRADRYKKAKPDSMLYNSISPYPGKLYNKTGSRSQARLAGEYKLGGYVILHLSLYPVEYIPKTGKLAYYKKMRVVVNTGQGDGNNGVMERWNNGDRERVKKIVDNPDAIFTYSGGKQPDSCDCVIITNSSLSPLFHNFAQFKTLRGIRTKVVLLDSIYANYNGIDEQDQIRNFIIDAYTNWGIKYVLLGGDDEIIPHRGFYSIVGVTEDYDIPADLYYGALDGNWNNNGDNKWGEPGEDDLYAEVFVGRFCVDSDAEALNLINKVITYETNPTNCTKALMAGEDLGWEVWGGEYKEEIRNGSSDWGYTTVGFPAYFNVDTLYDRSTPWDKNNIIPKLNSNVHLVNHLGHSNVQYNMKMENADVISSLTNTSYYIIHSQGCYPNSFDNRDPDGVYLNDCIAEAFTTIEQGAVAFVGNTRYGWGDYSTTNGASQHYDREFFDALFDENIYYIGQTLQDAKEDAIPFIDEGAMRWCYYELCLTGDPTLSIWTADPIALTVSHPESVTVGPSSFTVQVTNGAPVESALVCVSMDSTVYEKDYTDAAGEVSLSISPAHPGEMHISVVAHNYLPYEGKSSVMSTGLYIAYYKATIDDDDIGLSAGNADAYINPGETIELMTWVKNYGDTSANGVYGLLSTGDTFITMQVDSQYFGELGPLDTVITPAGYVFDIKNGCPDKHRINFTLTSRDNLDSVWVSEPKFTVYSPFIVYNSNVVDDGNDGALDPGETANLIVKLKNTGSGVARAISTTLYTDDSYITITDSFASMDTLMPNEMGPFQYIVSADPSTPLYRIIDFSIYVQGFGYEDTVKFSLKISRGGDFLVWDADKNHTGGTKIKEILGNSGYVGDYTQALGDYSAYLSKYKAVFVCLGIYPNNYKLQQGGTIDSLCAYLDRGGNLYMEGGDCWATYFPTSLQPYFHIIGINDGEGDLDTIIGHKNAFTQGMKFKYEGENNRIDRISPGDGAFPIFSNRPIRYKNGVAFRSGDYNTAGLSFEVAGLTIPGDSIAATRIMDWFLKDITKDVAIWRISEPLQCTTPEIAINPKVIIKNIGDILVSGYTSCKIDSAGVIVYEDSQLIEIEADSTMEIIFSEWTPHGEGTKYKVIASSGADDEPGNNTRVSEVISFNLITEINSPAATQAPTINGIIDSVEWAEGCKIDVSNILGKGGTGVVPARSVYLYVMNDAYNLYLGIDEKCDSSRDDMDGWTCAFDDNYDHQYPAWPDTSEGVLAGAIYMGMDMFLFIPLMSDSTHPGNMMIPITGKSSTASGNLQFEVKIPYGLYPIQNLNTTSGDTIGLHFLSGKLNMGGYDKAYAWWPQVVETMGNPEEMGAIILTKVGVEEITELPLRFKLYQNIPNPALNKVEIRYTLPREAQVELKIYNVSGQHIRTLVSTKEKPGYKKVYWDSKNNKGMKVASGIYFYSLVVDKEEHIGTKKIIIAH